MMGRAFCFEYVSKRNLLVSDQNPLSSVIQSIKNNAASRREFLSAAGAGLALSAMTGSVQARGLRGVQEPAGKAAARIPLKDGETIKMGVIGTGGTP